MPNTGSVMQNKSTKFQVGDIVRQIRGWDRFEEGEVIDVPSPVEYCYLIKRKDGVTGAGRAIPDYGSLWRTEECNLELIKSLAEAEAEAKKKKAPIKFDPVELDKVVLTADTRRSIVSVLKQHEKADKIFKDWGLGKTIEYGKGMTMLFHGPPGTGKTMAARCIAKSISKDLTVIDNAKLQSSIPGEMERNLQEVFKEASRKSQVLMLDECDSLIMSRQGMGMILSSEINCLLTEIEKFEGILILTTNRVGELDKALERRISLIVKFPKPDAELRLKIWRGMIPLELPLAADVDLVKLSSDLELTGGLIKNVILGAARLAVADDRDAIAMGDFIKASEMISAGTRAFKRKSKVLHGTVSRTADMGIGGMIEKLVA